MTKIDESEREAPITEIMRRLERRGVVSGAAVNTAVDALPSNGGAIVIAARPDGSRYDLDTTIALDKPVIGSGARGSGGGRCA